MSRSVVPLLLCAALVAAAPAPAAADRDADPDAGDGQGTDRNRVNLRVGGASTDHNGRPTICLEVALIAAATVEACGTGSGILHGEPGGEMAHFRGEWSVLHVGAGGGTGRVQLGAGFAELEVGDDRPGFQFGSPAAERASVAGPEGSVTVDWMRGFGRGFEAIASLTVGGAWFSGAPQLEAPQSRWQPFASLELGVGW